LKHNPVLLSVGKVTKVHIARYIPYLPDAGRGPFSYARMRVARWSECSEVLCSDAIRCPTFQANGRILWSQFHIA